MVLQSCQVDGRVIVAEGNIYSFMLKRCSPLGKSVIHRATAVPRTHITLFYLTAYKRLCTYTTGSSRVAKMSFLSALGCPTGVDKVGKVLSVVLVAEIRIFCLLLSVQSFYSFSLFVRRFNIVINRRSESHVKIPTNEIKLFLFYSIP